MTKLKAAGKPLLKSCMMALGAAFAASSGAAGLPELGSDTTPWTADVYYENHTAFRGKDATGKTVGLSKFRNTVQVEADKGLSDGWKFHGVLRGSWDGVYRMNKGQFGEDAGGPIMLQSTTPGGYIYTPHGAGPVTKDVVDGLGLTGNVFTNGYPDSPNDGLRVLGDRVHSIGGGVAFGVPVRPCDTDGRGCVDLGGYGDKNLSELEFSEFNDRLDFIREAYVRKNVPLADGKSMFLKIGKQQVVWGRTDLFRVLDVINPVDFSRNNIYDELQDIRIPMWIAQAEYRMGPSESMQDRNLQVVWNFDKFRPNILGQCGSPNVILDAGCFFRGMKTLWDYGGTVANFANVGPDTLLATNFGPGQIGLANVHLPEWSLENTQLGVKYEGVTMGGLAFSLNALHYRSQLPSLHGGKRATNAFINEYRDAWPYLISFDMYFPRVNLLGGSVDFESEALGAAIRMEGAMTWGEEFANTNRPELYSRNRVFRGVVGIDRPTFIPFINPHRTTLISGQLFWQHIFDHELEDGPLGKVGIPDFKDNFIATLLIKGFMMNDRVSPQLIIARDFRARSHTIAPAVEWSMSDDLKVTFGANFKGGKGANTFDDCRACNPWAPFTSGPDIPGDPMQAYSRGLSGFEPLGRFRAGPIGSAVNEDEIFVSLRYKF
ncbi:DUF1302 family protein [Azoarcus sp. L1K30]|uniref:DUF1302 family protein n=1 Tax=Azoarcus sp. L1K30 TaxID=2820277 RepID=UPI0020134062|nr:DUF1302 family protein [Azoarcus sp. L1K30]